MVDEVYLFNNGEAIEVRDAKTDEMIYQFSYRHNGVLIWNEKDDNGQRRIEQDHKELQGIKRPILEQVKSYLDPPGKQADASADFDGAAYSLRTQSRCR